MIEALLAAGMLLAFGAQPLVPWRAASLPAERRRIWALAALPLLAGGTLAAILLLSRHPDAALAQGLAPGSGSPYPKGMLVLLGGQALALLLGWIAGARMEAGGWKLLALFGLLVLLAAQFTAEVLRIGEAQSGPLALVFALIACRTLMALGAGEALAPSRPRFAPAASLGLAGYLLFLPRPIAAALLTQQGLFPFAAAALLFAAAPWLPERLRRPALLAAALLAGLGLTLAADLTRDLAPMGIG